jgi:hypothetical protein
MEKCDSMKGILQSAEAPETTFRNRTLAFMAQSLATTLIFSVFARIDSTIWIKLAGILTAQCSRYSHPPLLLALPLVFPSSVYFPSKSGRTKSTYNLQKSGGTKHATLAAATPLLSAAFGPPPSIKSNTIMGINTASPSPRSIYVGRRLSIPLRVLVAPASNPPKRRAKRIEVGLISREGLFRRRDSVQLVFVISGMVKRFAKASKRKALRTVEPF